ncbi:MAG: type VI secretion system baseplate subunit TssK [Planctomycetes bacterium]|nr:type VI secretion system baseplate subunit TssK [Planctomycetota bacterium]
MTGAAEDQVLWGEGMMLVPQHFQQLQRWVAAEARDRARGAAAYPWGCADLEIDQRALAGGQFALLRATGTFADGTPFAAPDRDPLPAARQLTELFPATQSSLTVFLALPQAKAGAAVFGADGSLYPFVKRSLRLGDEGRPGVDREIGTLARNLLLRGDGESRDGMLVLPVARVVRSGTGFALAADFVPPATTLSAAPPVVSVLRQVVGQLTQKVAELASRRRGGGGLTDATAWLLLHTAAGSLPGLRHCLLHDRTPPETAYLQLARLCAELGVLHTKAAVGEVPAYDHLDAGACFQGLGKQLQEMLGESAPTRCLELPIERQGDWLFTAKVPSPSLLTNGRLYLAVKADAPDEDVQARFPGLVKVSSKDRIQDLLIRAVPGLSIKVVPQPPPEIPVQTGRNYFVFEPGGEHWEAIVASLTLAVHVSPGLGKVTMELLAVKE